MIGVRHHKLASASHARSTNAESRMPDLQKLRRKLASLAARTKPKTINHIAWTWGPTEVVDASVPALVLAEEPPRIFAFFDGSVSSRGTNSSRKDEL